MIEGYPDIEYDEQTRRINRRMKFVAAPIALVLVVGLIAAIAAAVDSLSNRSLVVNDTGGDVVCYALFSGRNDDRSVRGTGRLAVGERGEVAVNSRCAVFNAAGDYAGCFVVSDWGDNNSPIMASSNNPRVKAAACVYPR
jgi:hypothetical protein